MTTDGYPKLFSIQVGTGRILGIAKGAGMIEPNLATMLVFIMTDIEIDRVSFRRLLKEVSADTFNRISVDGDQSTSDMVIGMSSCLQKNPGGGEFREGLYKVCGFLAGHIVRNGEGTSHVIRAEVRGVRTRDQADCLAKGIVNSPLVKTAVCGNDPNVGRILSALGDTAGNFGIEIDPASLSLSLGEETVFNNGSFLLDAEKEVRLSSYLKNAAMEAGNNGFPPHEREVLISVKMDRGGQEGFAIGSDLSAEYVKINADYRT
jgi:glutamate N-acetyltransferase/amino-acid N-acetyltransferase